MHDGLRIQQRKAVTRPLAQDPGAFLSGQGGTAGIVVRDTGRVVGYHGISPTAVTPTVLPGAIRTGQTPTPVLCLRPGPLARGTLLGSGRETGTGLLKHALERCVTSASLIRRRVVMVNAIDIEAAGLWRRRSFVPSKEEPLILCRSARRGSAILWLEIHPAGCRVSFRQVSGHRAGAPGFRSASIRWQWC